MLSLRQTSDAPQRPPGLLAIAVLFALLAAASFAIVALLLASLVPLSAGIIVLGGGLEQLGPLVFMLQGAIATVLALGLWQRWRWSRLAATLFAAAGILLAVPAMSSAVADSRIVAIAREGLQIVVRVVVIYYLSQEPAKEWFAAR